MANCKAVVRMAMADWVRPIVARDDGHERGLGDDAAERAAKSKNSLQHGSGGEKNDEGCGHVAECEPCEGRDVEGEAQLVAQLRGDQAANNGAGGPAGFQIAEAASSGVQDVAGQRDQHYVGADDAGHEDGVGEAQSAHQRLVF